MSVFHVTARARAVLFAVAALMFAGCDKDPNKPDDSELVATLDAGINTDSLGTQDPITIRFNRPINAQSALDPANFIVIDSCTGLRVPGSLRLSPDSTSVTFSPSVRLAFLTSLQIRVQNILDTGGRTLRAPFVPATNLRTAPPPVGDVSWQLSNSPTSDLIGGVWFVSPTVGYINTIGGEIFFTDNGGISFRAQFKSSQISQLRQIHAFTRDTAFVTGTISITGVGTRGALFRSTNLSQPNAVRLDTIRTLGVNEFPGGLSITRVPSGFVGVIGGQGRGPIAFRYDSRNDSFVRATGFRAEPGFTGIAISPSAMGAVLVARERPVGAPSFNKGALFRSLDSGKTYTEVVLPSANNTTGIFALYGVNYRTASEAIIVGDSSVIARFDVRMGTVTRLTGGVPQSSVITDANGVTTSITYRFNRSSWAPESNGQVGWVVGETTIRRTGSPDVSKGVILQTTDGGTSFTRQAILGAANNGEDFPRVNEVFALNSQFAALGGFQGLVAVRNGTTVVAGAGVCSFSGTTGRSN